jgi:carbonic anhydrase/acetyltransferase-like protein (isoleucine patch superfamily)
MIPTRAGRYLATRLNVSPTAFVAPGAVLVGEVTLGDESSVWYGCVLRGDMEPVIVGRQTNLQDGTVVHVDDESPARIGDRVTVGHRAVIHGCTVEDDCLIGMGAVILTGARVGAGSLVAAGAVVREGHVIPPGSLVAGVPAKVVGPAGQQHADRVQEGVEHYLYYAAGYRDGTLGGGPHGGGAGGAGGV